MVEVFVKLRQGSVKEGQGMALIILIRLKAIHLFFSSGEVCPLLGVDVVYELRLCELYLRCVGHPQLVALEDLGRAALATRGPAAVALPVTKLVRLKLQQNIFSEI